MSRHGHRFYVSDQLETGIDLALPDQASRQIANVLRLRPGGNIQLFNGDGFEYMSEITDVRRGAVAVRVTRRDLGMAPLAPSLTMGWLWSSTNASNGRCRR